MTRTQYEGWLEKLDKLRVEPINFLTLPLTEKETEVLAAMPDMLKEELFSTLGRYTPISGLDIRRDMVEKLLAKMLIDLTENVHTAIGIGFDMGKET